jgi:hypothetical protein
MKRGSSTPRDLVVVMAGDRSLHGKIAQRRDFDLWVVYYGDSDAVAAEYQAGADRFFRRKGLKIELVRRVLLEDVYFGEGCDYSQYRYVFMPDDDILFENGADDVHALFATAEKLGADAFQPAVKNDSVSFQSTRVVEGAACRLVNWVENMMPGYRSDVFRMGYLAAIHALEFPKSGWGTEPMAAKLAEAVFGRGFRAFIIDKHPAVHTRPVGQNGIVHEIGRDEASLLPQLGHNLLRTLATFRTVEEAAAHAANLRPAPRNAMAVELYMQKARLARKLWTNLMER